MEQNDGPFCALRFALHSAKAAVSGAVNRQNHSILSTRIDFARQTTICKRLVANDLRRRIAARQKTNCENPRAREQIVARRRHDRSTE
jgi:hypothetical protein